MELTALGCRTALIVTDAFLREKTGIVTRIQKALGAACAGVFSDVPPIPACT